MDRKSILIIVALFLVCYVLSRIFTPPAVVKEVSSSSGTVAALAEKPLPPEQLSQFKGMSVYNPPPPPKEFWMNPPDGPPPRKDKNEKYYM